MNKLNDPTRWSPSGWRSQFVNTVSTSLQLCDKDTRCNIGVDRSGSSSEPFGLARCRLVGVSRHINGTRQQRLILPSQGERRVLIQRRDTAAWRHHLCSFCLLLLVSSLSLLLGVMSEGRWETRLGMHHGYDSTLYTCKTQFLSLPFDHSSSLFSCIPSAWVCVCKHAGGVHTSVSHCFHTRLLSLSILYQSTWPCVCVSLCMTLIRSERFLNALTPPTELLALHANTHGQE